MNWFDLHSHIPSQPTIIQLISYERIVSVMSGNAVMMNSRGFLFYGFLSFILYSRSPRARERFRFPFTRPWITVPPAFSILLFSVFVSGLWSMLRGKARAPFIATARESPLFAQYILFFTIRTTLAVQPGFPSPNFRFPSDVYANSSIRKKVCSRAPL